MSTYCLYDSGPCFKDMLDKDKSASMREKKIRRYSQQKC